MERKGNEAGIKRERNDPAHMITFMLGGVTMRHLWVTYSAEDKLDREAEQQVPNSTRRFLRESSG